MEQQQQHQAMTARSNNSKQLYNSSMKRADMRPLKYPTEASTQSTGMHQSCIQQLQQCIHHLPLPYRTFSKARHGLCRANTHGAY